jgi:hypothetical protein
MKPRLVWRFLLLWVFLIPSYAVPQVDVFANPAYLGGTSGQFIFRKTGAGTAVVSFTFSGSALGDTNLIIPTGVTSVTIPGEIQELRLPFRIYANLFTNATKSLILTLNPDPSFSPGMFSSAEMLIIPSGSLSAPPGGTLVSTQWADHIDFGIAADGDNAGLSSVWLTANDEIIASFTNLFSGAHNFQVSWTNPPPGQYRIAGIAVDRQGIAGILTNPTSTITIDPKFIYPTAATGSVDGTSLTGNWVTSYNDTNRSRGVLFEFAIPPLGNKQ